MLDQAVPIQVGSWVSGARRRAIRVGGISLALSGASPDDVRLGDEVGGFECDATHADIEVSVDWAASLQKSPGESCFDSGAVWTLFANRDDELVFDFISPSLGPGPYKKIYTDRSLGNARIVLNHQLLKDHQPILPLEYPADELLFTNYLANGLGVEVHGCGLVDFETGGHLFLGHSGAGKSTTAKLWQSLRNPEILSDDRIILRLQDDGVWMHGTPWHGEAAFAAPAKARIHRIFILEHAGILEAAGSLARGEENKITPLTRSRAVGELFARSFPPFHSAAGLDRTVSFLERILNRVPCYQFQFVPDASAVEKVIGFHD
jgi:hypothetical protein